ncbi:hypothetical protein HETIRDRAFT_446735 [Heterobasidion irregulare TC 32-1]|uniref:T6SS Phospholipase effector Tle1-like catalytic domain-containing protein n=1 Tax=Heterobasidion irregulare (strain TC 32-1) TaxID=747525 RepID=W4JSQ6_HETIT|nr:uncharacterized protein HETIRDRAFT_446735 [Heterobasidion irregulare TC 32-1]ETW75891.1 hypothetical protein HETIRDRAFT_446735 [Heterobasidion irregulare TC 32-1]
MSRNSPSEAEVVDSVTSVNPRGDSDIQSTSMNVGDDLPSVHQTSACKCQPETDTTKNIIICIDGTASRLGLERTAVLDLYRHIKKNGHEERQIAFYHNGMGTVPALPSWRSFEYWKQILNSKIDLAIGWDFHKTIQQAYIWLSNNYVDGDRVYLFGFSRGAYQVRVLAAIIASLGVPFPNNEAQVPIAYQLYINMHAKHQPDAMILTTLFKETFASRTVPVHFLGAWDSVSSIGLRANGPPIAPDSMNNICFFRHALALDERRVKFMPTYAQGPYPRADHARSMQIKEVWFPGTHRDMGIRTPDNLLADLSFRWMHSEAAHCGLRLQWIDPIEGPLALPEDSMKHMWRLMELLPIRRLAYKGDKTTLIPNYARGRPVFPGQMIHSRVADMGPMYDPRAQGLDIARIRDKRRTAAIDELWDSSDLMRVRS